MSGGSEISYALWFRTKVKWRNQILLHFGTVSKSDHTIQDVMFSLTLDKGVPAVYRSGESKLVASDKNMDLATNEWQHIAVSMPYKSCRLSRVQMFVNGQRVNTVVEGPDPRLFFVTTGAVSVGGFGNSDARMETMLPDHGTYRGLIDEVYV